MSPEVIGVIGIVLLFALLAGGVPIGFAMGIVGLAGFAVLVSPQAALVKAEVSSFDAIAHADLASLPLFLLMAQIMYVAGISNDFYTLAARFIGHWRGGLAMATIGGCAGFGTVSGSSLATAATMGMVALPEMQSRKYSTALATGAVAAGGTLASTVPPSGMLIVYGVLTEQSIGKLFMAGLIPAITQAIFFLFVIVLWCRWRPAAGPPGPRFSWVERWQSLRSIGDLMLLLVIVVGGVVSGLFTAVESAAVGAVGSIARSRHSCAAHLRHDLRRHHRRVLIQLLHGGESRTVRTRAIRRFYGRPAFGYRRVHSFVAASDGNLSRCDGDDDAGVASVLSHHRRYAMARQHEPRASQTSADLVWYLDGSCAGDGAHYTAARDEYLCGEGTAQ
jgi:TRAP-type mannitol/chloroaromatic compound transport system permease large subunit